MSWINDEVHNLNSLMNKIETCVIIVSVTPRPTLQFSKISSLTHVKNK